MYNSSLLVLGLSFMCLLPLLCLADVQQHPGRPHHAVHAHEHHHHTHPPSTVAAKDNNHSSEERKSDKRRSSEARCTSHLQLDIDP